MLFNQRWPVVSVCVHCVREGVTHHAVAALPANAAPSTDGSAVARPEWIHRRVARVPGRRLLCRCARDAVVIRGRGSQ
jgi:hypothetical protein